MHQLEQRKRAREFLGRWRGRGDEKQDAQNFWRDLLVNVLGVPSTSITSFISFERKVQGGFIDGFIEDTGVLIEQKSLGVDLAKARPQSDGTNLTPYSQAVRYAAKLPFSIRPRWIVVSNFETILIYDQETDPSGENPYTLMLEDLPSEVYRLAFITDKSNSRLEKERTLSVKAGAVVGKLYSSFAGQYQNIGTDSKEQRSLNILIVRLVFLLYAEDAGLLQHHGALYDYLKPIPVPQMRRALIDLFKVLDTPDGTGGTQNERDPYMNPELLAFPYINGGLFSDESLIIPQLTDQIKLDLLVEASSRFDWAEVSPTIFGAVFESTLNPETRHEGGMHYTSVESIHKVIDPLFLDELKEELEHIETIKSGRDRRLRLRAFQDKLARIRVLDPACGSGNFLTESYLSLRRLENRVIEGLQGEQSSFEVGGDSSTIKVRLSQFFGIEINDFAVSVAKTALWIAESQMIEATQEIVMQVLDFLPLTSNSSIIEGNALRMDWNDVLPSASCDYIIGNPPFYGASNLTRSQAAEIKDVTGVGTLDYVAGWYFIATEYASDKTKIAFVSTNSITQGEQVSALWKPIFERGWQIIFAHQTFRWKNEAANMAHVHVVIVGLGKGEKPKKKLYVYESIDGDPNVLEASNINGYLQPLENIFIENIRNPLSDVPKSLKGSSPTDDGNLIIKTKEELDSILAENPEAEQYIKPYYGADEFLNGLDRWCLWMPDYQGEPLSDMPSIRKRLDDCKAYRESRTRPQTYRAKDTPWLFVEDRQPDTDYLIIPRHSSERRRWIPFGFVSRNIIASDATQIIPDASLYLFGVLSSTMHNAWMRVVAGRLESRYRYSVGIVYNNFIFPEPSEEQRNLIERAAQRILDARASYPENTLADLYDPDRMPEDLMEAHAELDAAVERAYGVDFNGDEEKMVAHLFKLYAEAMSGG